MSDRWSLKRPGGWQLTFALALTLAGLVAIAVATLLPTPQLADQAAEISPSCLVCGDLGGTDVALNLLLFAPFAAGLALLGLPTSRIFMVAGLLSLGIEVAQIGWIAGRDASLSDLLTNTTGATVCAALVNLRARLLRPGPATARLLGIGAVTAWLTMEMVTAWAVRPDLPASRYWGQWAAELSYLDHFEGEVRSVRVAGDSLPPHRIEDSGGLRARLIAAGGPVEVSAITGPAPAGLAPIASIFDARHREILLLGQRRGDILFRMRTHVSTLRLRPPAIRLSDVAPLTSGAPMELTASYGDGYLRLRITTGGHTTERTLAASPSWGWSFFMPFEHYAFDANARFLTALWIAGLLVPIGYWSRRAGSGTIAASWFMVAAGLAVVPWLTGLPPVHSSEWAAAVTGLALGHAVSGWTRSGMPAPAIEALP